MRAGEILLVTLIVFYPYPGFQSLIQSTVFRQWLLSSDSSEVNKAGVIQQVPAYNP